MINVSPVVWPIEPNNLCEVAQESADEGWGKRKSEEERAHRAVAVAVA